jgi:hypothetical protein
MLLQCEHVAQGKRSYARMMFLVGSSNDWGTNNIKGRTVINLR